MNLRRIMAVFKRHWYMTRHSPATIFEVLYWSFLDLLLWGMLTQFLRRSEFGIPLPVGLLLGAALLWDLLFRTSLGIGVAFLHETWSRNVIGLMASPLKPTEYVLGAALWTTAQLAVGWGVMATLAWALFHFGLFSIGLPLIVFVGALLLFGVAMALTSLGIVFRFGEGANVLAWGLAGLLMPLSAVYYPLATLPAWAQTLARALPPAHIFESMRAVLDGRPAPWSELGIALGLDLLYIVLAGLFARSMFGLLRRRGYVTRYA